ncbi:outer membrane protein assembly factor BamB family protein [Anatilimnocola floriformis]|uniref:outer membrane protein assembly factor BamB family protein n=1 Tax=Anatilimnocola floriformis TaxID=2948575 RepID=UPI0020C2272F|nr:PQQ-binding-like beta-propeller repeat protein [Anatilimnocola floriformis]
MSAVKILELAEEQGLLEPQVIATLRKQVQAKPNVTAELIAKKLVDKGLLTAFQSKKLLTAALAAAPPPELDLDLDLGLDEPPPAPAPKPKSKPTPPPAPVAEEDDDVVMLEAVEPAPKPKPAPTPAPKPKAPAPKPAAPAPVDLLELAPLDMAEAPQAPAPVKKPEPPKTVPPARTEKPKPKPAPAPAELAPMMDLAPLEPLTPAPAAKPVAPAPRPAAPTPAPAPLAELTPLGGPAPMAPLTDLAPLSPMTGLDSLGGSADLLSPIGGGAGLDPFSTAPPAANPLAPAPAEKKPGKPELKKKTGRANVWDSPLLLLGGGGLLVMIIAFVVLLYALTRGKSAEVFRKADEDFKSGQYVAAMAAFDKFIESYPKDPLISQARVMRGMSEIRQASSNSAKDPRSALKTTQEVLPKIEREAAFADVRDQLATILPEIADGFAEQAKATDQVARKVDLTKLADDSMVLVNNPSYLPSAQRKNLEGRIANILDKLSAARRSIDQEKELQVGLADITKHLADGKTADCYQVRTDLVRRFPGLEIHPQLIESTLAISERERQAVRISETVITAAKDDPRPVMQRIILASRQPGTGTAPASQPVFVTVEGAVYGLDLATGKVLWRRYVGHETQFTPTPVTREPAADVLVGDSRTHELYRLDAATGNVKWRLTIGEPFFQPTFAVNKLFVATPAGKIIEVDLTSGDVARQVVLPQKLSVPPAYDRTNSRLYQLGEHSTLFVINDSLACEETFYSGHKAGAILVPPVFALDLFLMVESPGDDFSLLRVVSRDPEKKKLREVDRPLRLKGRVVTPLAVAGKKVSVVTDLAQVDSFEIDPAIKDKPLQVVGKIEASESKPQMLYQATDGGRLWLAGHRCSMFEIQVSLQQLGRKWTLYQDDAFLAAPQIHADTLLHIRRRPNSAAVLVEACQAGDGKSIWVTQLAAPLIGLAADMEKKRFIALNSAGRVFEVPGTELSAGYYDKPIFTPPPGAGIVSFRTARQGADGRWLALSGGGKSFGLFYDPAQAGDRVRMTDLGPTVRDLIAPAVQFKQSLALPLSTGLLELINPTTGQRSANPFQPALAPGARMTWNEPAVLTGDRALVIGDGKQTVYRVGLKEGGQAALNKEAEARVEGDLISPIATAGDFVYAVVREGSGDVLQLLQAGNLALGAKLPLGGRYRAGPFAVGSHVFVELQERKLLAIAADRQAWQLDLARGPLMGRPQQLDNDLLLLHASGALARLSASDGKELAAVDAGEPLGDVVSPFSGRLLVGGRDGVLHVVTPPQASP